MEVKPPTILVVSAHAADFCSRSGGTLALYAKRGSAVHVIDLTYGERGESDSLWLEKGPRNLDAIKRIRREEAIQAATILGVQIEFFDFNDYPLVIDTDRLLRIVAKMREVRPEIVLTHWQHEPINPDHTATSEAVIKACILVAAHGVLPESDRLPYPSLFLFEPDITATEFTGFIPDIYVDVTGVYETKMKALDRLAAQPTLRESYTRIALHRGHQAKQLGHQPGITYAEGFKRYFPVVGPSLDAGLGQSNRAGSNL